MKQEKRLKQMGSTVEDGSFGENLLISGIDFNAIEVGPVLKLVMLSLKLLNLEKAVIITVPFIIK